MDREISEGKELLEECFKGKKEAWEIFVRRFSPLIYHSLKSTLRNKSYYYGEEVIEDLHNDVFLSLLKDNFKKLKSYDGRNGCTLFHWLKVVTVRVAIDFLRARRVTVSPFSFDGGEGDEMDKLGDTRESLEKNLERRDTVKVMQKAISKLPPRDQLFIKLLYYQELSFQETAQVLKIPIDSVYARHNYLKEKMRDKVKKYFL
jgi:RNA polymerase sigma-70 factor (ECF subfamily)